MVSSMINTHPGVLLFNLLQVLTICGIYQNEIGSPMPYSKFAIMGKSASSEEKPPTKIPSKIGMLIIYVPATIVGFLFQVVLPLLSPSNYAPTAAGWMVLAHFSKRDAEVLFLHKYSGNTFLNTACMIGFSYASNALMICLLSNPDRSSSSGSSNSDYIGWVLFAIGSLGNLYHHYLLAQLRSATSTKGATKEYKAPTGGGFEYVATPHYFFELIAWLGMAIASRQLTSYLNLVSMTCYLCARSYNHNQWNKRKFDEKDWPSSRKNLIPFLY